VPARSWPLGGLFADGTAQPMIATIAVSAISLGARRSPRCAKAPREAVTEAA